MNVKLMKKVASVFCLAIAFNTFAAEEKEIHFESNVEKTCTAEVSAVGCGTPTESNQDTFLACVDGKLSKLSLPCQEMHKTISAAHKAGHSH